MNDVITKVICKKKFRFFFKGIKYDKFILETEELSMPLHFTDNKIPYIYKYIFIYINEKNGYRFHLNKYNHTHFLPNFYDYFYDKKELRKLKIKQINLFKK